jgi:thiamine-triphosphatase
LVPFCEIVTTRRKYSIENFTIDLDLTDFGYQIGEVELMVENKEGEAQRATEQIEALCKEFNLDTKPPIRGKVLEYIYRTNPALYEKWERAGLLNNKQINK